MNRSDLAKSGRHAHRAFAALLSVALLLPAAASGRHGSPLSPRAALERLQQGNGRFAADASTAPPIGQKRRAALTSGQSPFAIVLSCADSRVPPEIVFNVGLGDLFVVRTAGEVVDRAVLASVEYAAEHLPAPRRAP